MIVSYCLIILYYSSEMHAIIFIYLYDCELLLDNIILLLRNTCNHLYKNPLKFLIINNRTLPVDDEIKGANDCHAFTCVTLINVICHLCQVNKCHMLICNKLINVIC